MTARKDEAVGVGGTGASNWSEPTKSSSMGFEKHVPDDVPDDAGALIEAERGLSAKLGKIEREREELTAGPTPREEAAAYDPVMAFITGEEEYSAAPPRQRGRPKGSRTDPTTRAARKAPETTIQPASPEEIEAIEAEYAKAREERMSDVGATGGEFERYAQEVGDRPRFHYETVPWEEAERLEKKMISAGKAQNELIRKLKRQDPEADAYTILNQARARFPGLTTAEEERLNKFYAQEIEAERGGYGREALRGRRRPAISKAPSLQAMVGDEDTEDQIPAGSSRYAYGKTLASGERLTNTDDFKQKYPDEFEALAAQGVSPGKGMFIKLNDQARKPKSPGTLVKSDPGFDQKKANSYYLNALLHRLSRHAAPDGSLFWVGYRDWARQEIEDGEDFILSFDDEGRPSWSEVSPYDPGELKSDPALAPPGKKEAATDDWWNREFGTAGEAAYVPEEERVRELETGAEPLETDVDDFEETGAEPAPTYDPTKTAGFQDIIRGRKPRGYAPFDVPEEEWPEYDPMREHIEMKLNEFFDIDEASTFGGRFVKSAGDARDKKKSEKPKTQDEVEKDWYDKKMEEKKLSSYEHPRTHLAKKFAKDPDVDEPWALAQSIASEEGLTEAQGERAAKISSEKGRDARRSMGGEFKPTDPDETGMLGFEGGEPSDEMGFSDPTSSQDPEHGGFGGDLPGSEGGPLEAPEGVFQGEEGFGEMDVMPDEMGTETPPPLPGGPEDETMAGSVGDPGFGAEQDEWSREPQTGEPGPQHRTKVDFPDYEGASPAGYEHRKDQHEYQGGFSSRAKPTKMPKRWR